jgi:hypothetical protein
MALNVRSIRDMACMPAGRSLRTLFAGLCMTTAYMACAHAPSGATTPESAVADFSRALEQGQLERAYALMTSEYRSASTLQAFKAQLEQHPRETLELGSALARRPDRQEAELRYGAGQIVRLRRQAGRWAISGELVEFYDQSTPRTALLSFVRALEAKRYDVLLRFVPEAERDGMTPDRLERHWSERARHEIERVLLALQGELDNPIEVAGERATMRYAERLHAQFVREKGAWKIEALE